MTSPCSNPWPAYWRPHGSFSKARVASMSNFRGVGRMMHGRCCAFWHCFTNVTWYCHKPFSLWQHSIYEISSVPTDGLVHLSAKPSASTLMITWRPNIISASADTVMITWMLWCHWLKALWQHFITLVTQGPGVLFHSTSDSSIFCNVGVRRHPHWMNSLLIFLIGNDPKSIPVFSDDHMSHYHASCVSLSNFGACHNHLTQCLPF